MLDLNTVFHDFASTVLEVRCEGKPQCLSDNWGVGALTVYASFLMFKVKISELRQNTPSGLWLQCNHVDFIKDLRRRGEELFF